MDLMKAVISTEVARKGMTMQQALQMCVDADVPGIPVEDDGGKIIARFSVRNAFLISSIPADIVKGAHLIGNEIGHFEIHPQKVGEILTLPIDDLLLEETVQLAPSSQAIKALALMEKFNTSYLFLTENGTYHGVVTRLGISRVLLDGQETVI